MNSKQLFSLIAGCILGLYGFGQPDNSLLINSNADSLIDPSQRIGFIVDNLNYIRNTEYHSNIEQGATWAGTQVWPQVVFRYTPNVSFKAGVFIQKDFGNHKFRTLIPTYTVSYTRSHLKVNFGTLDGSVEHRLIEPLYAIENYIDNRIENGIQFIGDKGRLKYDFWLDWQRMIYRTSDFQEAFVVGINSSYDLLKTENLALSIPFQMTLRHVGGEIYKQPHPNLKTQVNTAIGTKLTGNNPGGFIDHFELSGFGTFYEDLSPTKADSFFDGTGVYATAFLKHRQYGVMLNYWDAHQYVATLGEPLYISKSREYPGDYIQYRKMAMLRLMYELPLWQQGGLVIRMNNIYDFSEKAYNNSIEVFLKAGFGYNPQNRLSLLRKS